MRLTARSIYDKKKKQEKIVALTAYDYPLAKILDEAGIDIVLVGDSLGMVLLGFDSTVPVTMQHMLHHTKAVSPAVKRAMVVADMPFASYDTAALALRNAKLLVKAGANAVKLEGGRRIEKQVAALLKAGIPVMGHLGMTPQTAHLLGGYRVQGRTKEQADEILKDAVLLEKLGVFSIVLECVPLELGARITRKVACPTIGIGAGPKTDGQVLVLHDMLGFESPVKPRFVRRYADFSSQARRAVDAYRKDVLNGRFPSREESF